jgi:Flp pilus assembly protein TadG
LIKLLQKNRVAPGKKRRGQSIAEVTLVLPLLVILFSVIVEAGLALNTWNRVNTAARDATRFALDSGRPAGINQLVLYKLRGLDTNGLKIYLVNGTTDDYGDINNWTCSRTYPTTGPCTNMTLDRDTVQRRLREENNNLDEKMPFTIVEVDYEYVPLLTTLVASGARLPMMSFAIVQQY